MKPIKTAILLSSLLMPVAAEACTNFIAGRKATTDGSVMVTYADDSHTRFGDLFHASRATYAPGEMRRVIDWATTATGVRSRRLNRPTTWSAT